LVLLGLAAASALAQNYKTAVAAAPPGEVPEGIRGVLDPNGVKVTTSRGFLFTELWLRSAPVVDSMSLGEALEKGSIPEGALIGVIHYASPGADVHGKGFKPGFYTLRYAGGDSVLLVPAEGDPAPDPRPLDEPRALSSKITGNGEPLMLRITKGKPGNAPRLEMTRGGEWIVHTKAGDTPVAILVVGVARG
jgi:hypothetical protein